MPTEVLLTFYCDSGATESLVLAAAVGAVQARASIRLRRLQDVSSSAAGSESELARMRLEYVPPTEADILRADAIVFAAPRGFTPEAPEWFGYLDLLARLGAEGKLAGKVATVLGESDCLNSSLISTVLELGFITIPRIDSDPLVQGRRTAVLAAAVKEAAFER